MNKHIPRFLKGSDFAISNLQEVKEYMKTKFYDQLGKFSLEFFVKEKNARLGWSRANVCSLHEVTNYTEA